MLVYVLAFGLSIGLYLVFSRGVHASSDLALVSGDRARSVLPFFLSAIPLIIVSGIRYNVGTDYFTTYYSGFYRIYENNYFDGFEFGYVLLNKFIQFFSTNVFLLFFVTSAIFIFFVFASFKKMSPNIPFSILLLFLFRYYFISMNAIRQMLACSIFSLAIYFAIKREVRPYLLLCFLAFSFHYSSIVLFPTYWLMNIEWNPKRATGLLVLMAAIGTVSFPVVAKLLPGSSKYAAILNGFSTAGSLFTIGTICLNLFILSLYYQNYLKCKNEWWYRCFLYLQIAAVGVTFFLPFIPNAERIYWSFSFHSMIGLPLVIEKIDSQSFRLVAVSAILIIFTIYSFYDISVLKDHQVIPYSTIVGRNPSPYSGFDYRYVHKLYWWN